MSGRIGIVLQARCGSYRLPGKVMLPLDGIPMIGHCLARLSRSERADALILAVPEGPADDELARMGERLGAFVFRGSEVDVLDRFVGAARMFDLAAIVRATGDNPLVDVEELDRLVDLMEADGLEYASARTAEGSGLPIGVGVEAFSREALEVSAREATDENHLEHVDEYIQERPAEYRAGVLQAPADKRAPELSLTVDTPEDFLFVERVIEGLGGGTRLTTEAIVCFARDADHLRLAGDAEIHRFVRNRESVA